MKVIIIGPAYPYRGGLASFDERFARQFILEGHEVEIVTFTLQYPSFLFPGKTQYSTDPAPKDLLISRRVNSCNPFNWIKVGRELRRKEADIVIFRYWISYMAPCLGTIARIIRRNGKSCVVSIIDNLIPHEQRFFDKPMARYFINSLDACVTMSKSVLNDISLFSPNKPRVFSPHPVYDNYGEAVSRESAAEFLKLDKETRYILFFGLIRDYKGLDWLLEAFAKCQLQDKNVKLIVAGEFYNNPDKYYDIEKRLNLKEKVLWFNNFVPDSEVKYFFSIADMVVQPYKTATQSGITLLSYFFEKPVIVTNVGGLGEFVPNGKVGYMVEPDIESIANAINDFYNNNRLHDFDEGIKEEKKRYVWSRLTESLLKLRGGDDTLKS